MYLYLCYSDSLGKSGAGGNPYLAPVDNTLMAKKMFDDLQCRRGILIKVFFEITEITWEEAEEHKIFEWSTTTMLPTHRRARR